MKFGAQFAPYTLKIVVLFYWILPLVCMKNSLCLLTSFDLHQFSHILE